MPLYLLCVARSSEGEAVVPWCAACRRCHCCHRCHIFLCHVFFPTKLCGALVFGSVPPPPHPRPPPHTHHLTQHTSLSNTSLSHTIFVTHHLTHTFFHTPSYTHHLTLSHTHTTLSHKNCHVQLCQIQLCHMSHTTLSHVTHNFVTYNSVTYNFVTHTTLSHTTLSHTTLSHTPSFHVAGLALGDIRRRFTWQAWHLATSTFVLLGRRGTYDTWLGLVTRLVPAVTPRQCAWQAWHLATPRHFAWQAWHTGLTLVTGLVPPRDAAPLCVAGVALGDIYLRFTWQAWHLATSTFVLRGRRGAWRHFVLCGGRRGTYDICFRFTWQAWHLATPTFVYTPAFTHLLSLTTSLHTTLHTRPCNSKISLLCLSFHLRPAGIFWKN